MCTLGNDFETISSGKMGNSLKGLDFGWCDCGSCSTPLGPADLVGVMSQMHGFDGRLSEAAVGVESSGLLAFQG